MGTGAGRVSHASPRAVSPRLHPPLASRRPSPRTAAAAPEAGALRRAPSPSGTPATRAPSRRSAARSPGDGLQGAGLLARQQHREGGPAAGRPGELDAPTVRLRDAAREPQAQAEATVVAGGRAAARRSARRCCGGFTTTPPCCDRNASRLQGSSSDSAKTPSMASQGIGLGVCACSSASSAYTWNCAPPRSSLGPVRATSPGCCPVSTHSVGGPDQSFPLLHARACARQRALTSEYLP